MTYDIFFHTYQLLDKLGLHDWSVQWDNAKRRAGACNYNHKRISYSRHLIPNFPVEEQKATVIHEVAHALCPPRTGHGPLWKRTVRQLGGNPEVYISDDLPKAESDWIGYCPKCGHERHLHSRPRRVSVCIKCNTTFNLANSFIWFYKGKFINPGGKYGQEYQRLLRQERLPVRN